MLGFPSISKKSGPRAVACALLSFVLCAGTMTALPAIGAPQGPNLQPGGQLLLRQTFNGSRFVYIETGSETVVYEHKNSRLFPVVEELAISIDEVKRDDRSFEVKYRHRSLGKGSIKADLRGVSDRGRAVSLITASAFRDHDAPDDYFPIIGNIETKVTHFAGSNHLPDHGKRASFHTLEQARADGMRSCEVCFFSVPRVSNYLYERALGAECAATVRYYNPPVRDAQRQLRLEEVGAEILQRWPLPLKGYPYSFELVESDEVNASACPGGRVFVNTALMDTFENDAELEAILAHEIGHVELRHGYRQLRSAQRAAMWGAIAAAVAAGVTAAATDSAWDATTAAELSLSLSVIASQIVLSGYGRGMEMESDSMAVTYLQTHPDIGTSAAMDQVLRKLRYSQEVRGFEVGGGGMFASHPDIESRIEKASTAQTQTMTGTRFIGKNNAGETVATLDFMLQSVSQARDGGGLEVLASLETTTALGEQDKIKDMKVQAGGRRIKLDNKEDTEVFPSDSVGMMFLNDDQRSFLGEITSIDLDLRNVRSWTKETVPPELLQENAPVSVVRPRSTATAPAAPPAAATTLISPVLVNRGVEWTTTMEDEVGYVWAAEVENPNVVAIRATVYLRLLDASGAIIHEATQALEIGPGETSAFTEEGAMPGDVASRAGNWEFTVEVEQ